MKYTCLILPFLSQDRMIACYRISLCSFNHFTIAMA